MKAGARIHRGVVWSVAADGSEAEAGLKIGDRIVEVDGSTEIDWDSLVGPAGDIVQLKVQRGEELISLSYVRRDVRTGTFGDFGLFDLIWDKEGALWLCESDGAIVRFRPPDTWELVEEDSEIHFGLYPRFGQSADGSIWVGTHDKQEGLMRFDGRAWEEVRRH